jgi:AcrR family transcriptional regulator
MSTLDDILIFVVYGIGMTETKTVRRRDAAATRLAILASARSLFARDSFENVGIREIASDAGVDAALVSRYFGSKEELFAEVLSSGKCADEVIGTTLEGLPNRVADMLMEPDDDEENPMDDLLILLHSSGSQIAAPLVRASIAERFHIPSARLIGGDNAIERAQLLGAMLMGISISTRVNGEDSMSGIDRAKLKARISELIQRAIDPL